MFCPRGCGIDLAQASRQGVSIDYCPKCQGVWLDRGELEKIIQLSTQSFDHLMPPAGTRPGQSKQRQPEVGSHEGRSPHRHRDDDDDDYFDRRNRRKKEGWLGEIFDIFD